MQESNSQAEHIQINLSYNKYIVLWQPTQVASIKSNKATHTLHPEETENTEILSLPATNQIRVCTYLYLIAAWKGPLFLRRWWDSNDPNWIQRNNKTTQRKGLEIGLRRVHHTVKESKSARRWPGTPTPSNFGVPGVEVSTRIGQHMSPQVTSSQERQINIGNARGR
jgi:hypothetical protein